MLGLKDACCVWVRYGPFGRKNRKHIICKYCDGDIPPNADCCVVEDCTCNDCENVRRNKNE